MTIRNSSFTSQAPPSLDHSSDTEQLLRIFNTAIVSTRGEEMKNPSQELQDLIRTPGFKMILEATRSFAEDHKVSVREAAETLIRTFRKVDAVWENYLILEGIERLKSPPR